LGIISPRSRELDRSWGPYWLPSSAFCLVFYGC